MLIKMYFRDVKLIKMYSRQKYGIPRRAFNIIGLRLNIAYAFILNCSRLSEPILFEMLRTIYELYGPKAAFEYWCLCLYFDNLSKTDAYYRVFYMYGPKVIAHFS